MHKRGEYTGKWFNPAHKKDADDAEKKADRVWTQAEAQAIADAVRGEQATVTEESKTHHTGIAPPVRFDQFATRGQRQIRLQRQDHAVDCTEPVRAPQGA